MIKIKDIISEITGKEAFNKYVPLKDEEISLMKQLLDDNGILIKIQQKTGKVKSHTEKNFFEFPNDLNEPSLKSQFDKIVNRVKEIRGQIKKLDDVIRKAYGEDYLNKKLKKHYANQYTPILKKYTDATLKTMKKAQEKGIENQKAGMATARDKYRQDLRKWYASGKKGPEPKMPIRKDQQQYSDNYNKDFKSAMKRFNS